MFKWPGSPSPRASKHELADFAELTCWQNNHTSATALSRLLGRLNEYDYSGGVPEDDETDRDVEEVYMELERRQEVCGNGYPFMIGEQGVTLQTSQNASYPKHVIYKYLLMATRMNMGENRTHAQIDGTALFQQLSAQVARKYFGPRAESLVFGAEVGSSNFEDRVNDLCHRLREGGGFVDRGPGRSNVKDGKLDVVAWKPFADGLPGKLIGFGQCKTGTNYKDSLVQLQPTAFRDKWLSSSIVVPPVRMFFISEALTLTQDDRYQMSIDAGLLFDRCRILDFSDGIDGAVISSVREWTTAAAEATALPGL